MRRVAMFVLVAVVVQAAALLGDAGPARAAGAVRPPVIETDFPDPAIVGDGLGTYYLFSTNVFVPGQTINVPVERSSDMSTWTYIADALPTLGRWASPGLTWAPGVARFGATWTLYYTALDIGSGRQCIGVATSSSPTGPFVDGRAAPLVCQLTEGGSIDPSPYVDGAGNAWLSWKSDGNAVGRVTRLWSQRLSANGLTLTGSATPILTEDRPWENGIIEAPSMLTAGGILWLFYSAGPYDAASYATGIATCASPSGPCTKQTTDGPWMSGPATGTTGPGGEFF
jgi:beta-xylosidase